MHKITWKNIPKQNYAILEPLEYMQKLSVKSLCKGNTLIFNLKAVKIIVTISTVSTQLILLAVESPKIDSWLKVVSIQSRRPTQTFLCNLYYQVESTKYFLVHSLQNCVFGHTYYFTAHFLPHHTTVQLSKYSFCVVVDTCDTFAIGLRCLWKLRLFEWKIQDHEPLIIRQGNWEPSRHFSDSLANAFCQLLAAQWDTSFALTTALLDECV